MTQHRHRRSGCTVIVGCKHPSAKRAYAQRMEIGPGHIFGAQCAGHGFHFFPPHAQAVRPGLECSYFFEFRCFRLQPFIERIREHPPAVLRPALHAAIIAFAHPVQSGRIRDRQRPQHHRMDKRKDRRGAANSQGQRKHSRTRKHRRQPELPQSITNVSNKILHPHPSVPMNTCLDGRRFPGLARNFRGSFTIFPGVRHPDGR